MGINEASEKKSKPSGGLNRKRGGALFPFSVLRSAPFAPCHFPFSAPRSPSLRSCRFRLSSTKISSEAASRMEKKQRETACLRALRRRFRSFFIPLENRRLPSLRTRFETILKMYFFKSLSLGKLK